MAADVNTLNQVRIGTTKDSLYIISLRFVTEFRRMKSA